MKKFFVLLALLCTPVFATEATVTRVQKEVSNQCYSLINNQHTLYEVMNCFSKAYANPYVWRDGWDSHVRANVSQMLIDPDWLKYKNMMDEEKEAMKAYYMQTLPALFKKIGVAAYQSGNTKLTADQIKKLR